MKPTRSIQPTLRQLLSGCSLSAMLFAQNAAAFTIAQNPPFLPTPLPPNIVLTFDDSGSMRWAFNPESICSIELSSSTRGARRTKSSAFNALYYNPALTYDAPLMYDATSGNYTPYSTSFTAARINGFNTSSDTVDLSSAYRVTWAFAPQTTSFGTPSYSIQCGNITPDNMFARNNATDFPAKEMSGVAAYYYLYDPTGTGCTSPATTNDACYRRVTVSSTSGPGGTDERQNFANWYSFYRTRNLMTSSAATRAMKGVPPTARVGWQALNTCNGASSGFFTNACTGWAGSSVDKRIKVFDGQHRQNMYYWLARFPANSGTSLRTAAARAGEYFRTSGRDSPYAINPTVTQGTEHSCRPNFHILMTDGLWNDGTGNFCGGSNCNNRDNTAIAALPDGNAYSTTSSLTQIYRDSSSDTVADIAFYYWSRDLRTDLNNTLIPYRADRTGTELEQYWNPKNDPATWQHLVTFTVGLGLTQTLNVTGLEWGGSTYAAPGYPNLLNGTNGATWPAAAANATPGNVYDLWHAAINSRGQSFSADTPRDLSDALLKALNRILERESAAAALATNSSRLAADSMLFQARFFSGAWSGDLTAYAIGDDGALGAVQWEATEPGKIPAHGSRKIYSWSGTAGMTFDRSSLEAAALWTSIGSDSMLNYLRGDTSNENPNGLRYRARSGPLGDIINSDPTLVAAENYGYSWIGSEGASYPAFLAAKKSRAKMLYVGSNDGFLRAFNAANGEEAFAYVPNAVVPDLPLLAATDYAHRFYVDGAPAAWDAYFGSGGSASWRTVLTGTTGAGGRSVFALDVTSPSSFDASKVLWEINQNTAYRSTGSSTDAADPQYAARLGYTLGQAVVFKLNNGEWAAIFGNGYSSPGSASPSIPGNQASLYVVRISDGTLIRRIDTGVGSSGAPNGLGTPTLFDANGDSVGDAVYAPDMRGNVWKFSLSGTDPSSWGIAFGAASGFPNGAPLFQARSGSNAVQPISARIELASPPPGKAGVMVLFGTGRFFAVGDNTDATGQTFYGIWDNGSAVTATDRSVLQQQTIGTESIDLRGTTATVRNVTSNPVDWASKRGWFIDLPTSMERVTGPAAVRDYRVIFTTMVPSSDPCEFGGTGWLMEVSAFTGAKLPYSVFDTNGDKLVTIADKDISGVPIGVGMVKRPLVVDGTPVAGKYLAGTKGEIQLERNRAFGPPLGRESWREVQR